MAQANVIDAVVPATVGCEEVCILCIDTDLRVQYANREYMTAARLDADPPTGRGLTELSGPDLPKGVLDDLAATLATGARWSAPFKWRAGDGTALWLSSTFVPRKHGGTFGGGIMVGTRVALGHVRAVESVYRAMRRYGLGWREAVSQGCHTWQPGAKECHGGR